MSLPETDNSCSSLTQLELFLLPTSFMLDSCWATSSTLKMEMTASSKTLDDFQRTSWRYISEDRTLQLIHFWISKRNISLPAWTYSAGNRSISCNLYFFTFSVVASAWKKCLRFVYDSPPCIIDLNLPLINRRSNPFIYSKYCRNLQYRYFNAL